MIPIYMKGRKQHSRKGNNKSKVRAIVIGLKRLKHEMFGGLSTSTAVDAVDTKINMTRSLSSSLAYGKESHLIQHEMCKNQSWKLIRLRSKMNDCIPQKADLDKNSQALSKWWIVSSMTNSNELADQRLVGYCKCKIWRWEATWGQN